MGNPDPQSLTKTWRREERTSVRRWKVVKYLRDEFWNY